MVFLFLFLTFVFISLDSNSIQTIEKDTKNIEQVVELLDYNLNLTTGNNTTSTIKLELLYGQPVLEQIVGHTGFLLNADKQTIGKPIVLSDKSKFNSGMRLLYIITNNTSKRIYRYSFDYLDQRAIKTTKKDDDSYIFLLPRNTMDVNNQYTECTTDINFKQSNISADIAPLSLKFFNSSFTLYSCLECNIMKLNQSLTGINNSDKKLYGYIGKQDSIGLGSNIKFEYKRTFYESNKGIAYLHTTIGYGFNFTFIKGDYLSINSDSTTNKKEHYTKIKSNTSIPVLEKKISLTYHTNPTSANNSTSLIAVGLGRKKFQNINQIDAINTGLHGNIQLNYIFLKVGYSR